MDNIESLLQKAQQYLRSAAILLETGDLDSCASRAYFAMSYAALAAVLAEGYDLDSNEAGVRTAFAELFVQSGRFPNRAAQALDRAHALQQEADYSPHHTVEQYDAERVVQEAEAFVNSVGNALGALHPTHRNLNPGSQRRLWMASTRKPSCNVQI